MHAAGIPDPREVIAGNDAAAEINPVAGSVDELVVGDGDLSRGRNPPGVRGTSPLSKVSLVTVVPEKPASTWTEAVSGRRRESQSWIVTLFAPISTVSPPKLMPFRTAPFFVTTTR